MWNFGTKSGFTLVELLVAITIIGILIALLIPAVQSTLELARQIQCTNNLKQISLGLLTYAELHGELPFATPFDNDDDPYNKKGGTWAAMLLPFIEQQALHDQFNFKEAMNHPDNAEAIKTVVKTYICPSDASPSNAIFDDRDNLSRTNPAPVLGLWYPVSMGPTHPDHCPFCPGGHPSYCCQGWNYGSRHPDDNSVGMFGRYPRGVALAEVSDSLSNTIMVGESIPSQCIYCCAYCPNFPLAGTSIPINIFETVDVRGGIHYRACGFKSRHPDGANFAMGDGSVHFFPEWIDYQLYNELGTRAGGENAQLP